MVIALEIWIGKPGDNFGVRLEENVLVTREGYKVITKFPVDKIIECWT